MSPSSVMSASTCAACDIIHSIKANHSRILMMATPNSYVFSVATESLEEKLVLAVGSIRRRNQDIPLGFDIDKIKM